MSFCLDWTRKNTQRERGKKRKKSQRVIEVGGEQIKRERSPKLRKRGRKRRPPPSTDKHVKKNTLSIAGCRAEESGKGGGNTQEFSNGRKEGKKSEKTTFTLRE